MSDIENGEDSFRGEDDFQAFVKVMENEDTDDFVELPAETDDTILMSTLQGQFPNAAGLRYKSSSGGWRGVRISDGVLNPPHGGWGDTVYFVTLHKEAGSKRKNEDNVKEREREDILRKKKPDLDEKPDTKASERHLLEDMIVLSLPYGCKDSDLKEYFTSACGEMSLNEVKYDRQTKKPRGFGFIRFKTIEGAKAALTGEHSIMGRTVEIRLSKKKEEPMKLFIGRIPDGTSAEDLKTYFSDFGEVKDAYIPTPPRGFGFVTYACSEDGRAVLRRSHTINGAKLNVQFAEPKEEKMARRRREEEERFIKESARGSARGGYGDSYQIDVRDSRGWDGRDAGRDRDGRNSGRYNDYDSRGADHRNQYSGIDSRTSELKNMLYSLLNGGGR